VTRPGSRRSDALVIIPAFNEATTIAAVIAATRTHAPDLDVLVIDDGSRDATASRARELGVDVVSHPFNLGYGAALQTGYKHADRGGYAAVVQMDADGQHDPRDILRLLAPLRAGEAEIVIGSRFAAASGYRMGALRTLGRSFLQRLLRACGGPAIADPTSGFQALAAPAFRYCCADFYPSDFPDVDVLLLLHRQGFRIREVPVTMAASPPDRAQMHAGARALYYPYKMLLSTFRSALAPRKEVS
jgi:hypothetical protein